MKIASLEIELMAGIARLQQDMRRAEGVVERSMRQIETQVQRVQRAFGALGIGLGLGATVRQVQQLADAWQGMENRLRLVTSSNNQLARSMEDVFKIAQRTSSGLDATAQVFQRFAQNAGALGINMEQVALLTETVSKAVAVSGASAASAEAALVQFGQALASGVLRGDEFNSVMEQTPALMQALAMGMGVPLGALRQLAADGKITGDVIVNALTKASDAVDQQFSTRIKTVSQAFTELHNAVTRFVGQAAQSTGITGALSDAISKLAENIDFVAKSLLFLAATAIPAVTRAMYGLTVAMMKNPFILAATAVVALGHALWPIIEQSGLLATVWDTMGAAFDAVGGFMSTAIQKAGEFFGVFEGGSADLGRNLREPIQQGALVIATTIDAVVGGFAAISMVATASADNVRIAFVNAFNSVRETVSEVTSSIASKLNELLGTNFDTTLWVGPGPERYRDWAAEAVAAFQSASEAFGMHSALVQRFAQRTFESIDQAFDISLVDGFTEAVGRSGNAAGKANSAYQTLISTIRSKIEQNQLEIATGEKASEADKLRIKVIQDLAAGRLKLTAAQKQQVEQLLRGLKASESELNISRMVQAAKKKEVDLSVEAVKAAYDEARKNEHLAETFGMTAAQVEQLTLSRLEEKLAQAESLKLTAEEIKALELLIEAKQKNIAALGTIEAREKQKAAWESWARDVEQIFQQVGQSLTDAIFEGGKSARDLVRDLFKTLTLRVLVQPVMSGLQGLFTGAGPAGVANAASAGGGMLGNSSSLFSMFGGNSMGMGISNVLSGLSTSSALSGTGVGNYLMGLSGNVAGMSNLALGGAGLLGGLGAGLIFGNKGYSSVGGGLGATAGMVLGGPIGAVAGSLIGGGLGSLFGDSGPPKTRHGQRTTIDYAGGAFGVSALDDRQAAGSEQAALAAAQSAVAAANDLFAKVGVNAGIESFYAVMESSVLGDRNGVASGGSLRIGDQLRQIGIKQSGDMTLAGFGGWSSAEMLPRLQTDIQLSILEAFQSVGDQLPSVLSGMLEGVDLRNIDAATAQDLATRFAAVVDGATGFLAAVESMPFEQLRNLSFDAAAGLVAAAGGLENLNSGLASYYDNFYSQEEKLARSAQNISSALGDVGLEMPDVTQGVDAAKAAFRELFESIDPSTEWGATAMATMLGVNQSFADLAAGLQELNGAAETATEAVRSLADIERERLGLESQLLGLMGNTNELRRRELETLDASNRALQQQIWAYQDLSTAYNEVVAAGEREISKLKESFGATDTAMSAYRSAVQKLESEFGNLIATIGRGVADLRGQVAEAARMQYDQARAVISTALVTRQLPQTADLTETLRIAQQGVTGQVYGSLFEQQKAYLILANEMEALQGIAKPELDAAQATLVQLENQYRLLRGMSLVGEDSLTALEQQLRTAISTEEAARRQISAIEEQINWAKEQHDRLLEIRDGVLSFPDALASFAQTLAAAIAAGNKAAAPAAPSLPGGGPYAPVPGTGIGSSSWTTDYLYANQDVLKAYDASWGLTPEAWAQYHWDTYGKYEGRSYDVGTSYVPHDMLANIHKGEIIINPRDSDILRNYGIRVQAQGGGGSNREMIAVLERIEVRLERLEAPAKATAQATGQFADQFDQVTEGANALRTEIMNKVEVAA